MTLVRPNTAPEALIDPVAGIIRRVASDEILPRFRALSTADIREKGPGDLVTVADEAAEVALEAALTDLLPGSTVVGEEGATRDPSVVDRLNQPAPVWVIDPIDGTANYAAGREPFGVIVALVQNRRTVAGWIYLPATDVMITAVSGGGAWIGDDRVSVGPERPPSAMSAVFTMPAKKTGARRSVAEALSRAVGSYGAMTCVAAHYIDLARGATQVALFSRLKPWDHAAGMLIHAEAGGHAAGLDGRTYVPVHQVMPFLVAPTEADWRTLRQAIAGPALDVLLAERANELI